jgi:hypothetical protein
MRYFFNITNLRNAEHDDVVSFVYIWIGLKDGKHFWTTLAFEKKHERKK